MVSCARTRASAVLWWKSRRARCTLWCALAGPPVGAAGAPPLGTLQVQLRHTEEARVGDLTAIGERGEGLQPQVYPRLLPGEGQRLDRHLRAGDRHGPAIRRAGDRDGLVRALQGAGPTHRQPPNLGPHQVAIVPPSAVAVLLVGKRVGALPPLETRKARLLAALHPSEEALIGRVEPAQHILEEVERDTPPPREPTTHPPHPA